MRRPIEGGGLEVELYLNPVPASRPRVGRFGTYYRKTYKAWKKAAESAVPQNSDYPLGGPLIVTVVAVCSRPKTTKRYYPRGDVDNFAKGILDVLTKRGYWNDDDQIVDLYVRKRYPGKHERPHVWVKVSKA